jgi:serine protease AprX
MKGRTPSAVVKGIATFDRVPTRSQANSLRSLGLAVQPMKHLPLALVRGQVGMLQTAVRAGLANDVYADEQMELFDKASADSMGAARVRAKGYTGKGITVAVVDSGCDATHPDLADHVVHNVKVVSAEYVNLPPDSRNTLVVPVDQSPYSNTDLTAGHGTHVAGIIAADGTSDPTRIGVAPDAELVCIAIGEGIFTTAVVTAYDFLMDQPDKWGVDVINNSWGNSFYMFDPRHPVHVATKAVADQGVVVVFAAGNAGDSNAEMSLNLFSTAPWVIGVAAATADRRRSYFDEDGAEVGGFSSNGLMFDNARPLPIGPGGHRAFRRPLMGMYHPDIAAPGVRVSSSCTRTGVAPGPCPNHGNISASGTSFASPHIAGAAALLLQANPQLTPAQVQSALVSTASPSVFNEDENGKRTKLGFWQVGYGFVRLDEALRLVTSENWAHAIAARQRSADRRVMRSIGYTVARSDMWTYDAPPVALFGSDSRTYRAWVADTISHVKVTLAHPSLYLAGANGMIYDVLVRDAAGKELGVTAEADAGHGTSSLMLDLTKISGLTRGFFEFEISGVMAVSDPDNIDSESLLGRAVVLQVAQLVPLRQP